PVDAPRVVGLELVGLVQHRVHAAATDQLGNACLGEHRRAPLDGDDDLAEPALTVDVESVGAVQPPAIVEPGRAVRDTDAACDVAIALLDVDVAAVIDGRDAGEVRVGGKAAARVDAQLAIT